MAILKNDKCKRISFAVVSNMLDFCIEAEKNARSVSTGELKMRGSAVLGFGNDSCVLRTFTYMVKRKLLVHGAIAGETWHVHPHLKKQIKNQRR